MNIKKKTSRLILLVFCFSILLGFNTYAEVVKSDKEINVETENKISPRSLKVDVVGVVTIVEPKPLPTMKYLKINVYGNITTNPHAYWGEQELNICEYRTESIKDSYGNTIGTTFYFYNAFGYGTHTIKFVCQETLGFAVYGPTLTFIKEFTYN